MNLRVLARVTVAALAAATLVACSGDGADGTDGGDRRPTSTGPNSTIAPDSPAVVAATALGKRSRAQIVSLHAVATSRVTGRGIPRAELPRQARSIGTALRQQVTEATRLPPPAGSPAASLVSSLRSYEQISGSVAAGAAPKAWLGRLRAADAGWQQAMRALSAQSGTDLLAGMPPLTVPAG